MHWKDYKGEQDKIPVSENLSPVEKKRLYSYSACLGTQVEGLLSFSECFLNATSCARWTADLYISICAVFFLVEISSPFFIGERTEGPKSDVTESNWHRCHVTVSKCEGKELRSNGKRNGFGTPSPWFASQGFEAVTSHPLTFLSFSVKFEDG